MKLVKEHINEKFEEHSDPIKDMGIGINKNMIKKWILENTEYTNWGRNIEEKPYYLLSISAQYGRLDFIEHLIDYMNFDINVQDDLAFRSAIFDCKEKNKMEVIKFLLDKGAKLDKDNLDGLKHRNKNIYDFITNYWKNK